MILLAVDHHDQPGVLRFQHARWFLLSTEAVRGPLGGRFQPYHFLVVWGPNDPSHLAMDQGEGDLSKKRKQR